MKNLKCNKIHTKNKNIKLIDQLLIPTKKLWKNLEYNCTAECCGIDAFSFEEEAIWSATLDLNIVELINQIEVLLNEMSDIEEDIIQSNILNQLMYKNGFNELLKHLMYSLVSLNEKKT